jgi:carboxyl-terminal processing protease
MKTKILTLTVIILFGVSGTGCSIKTSTVKPTPANTPTSPTTPAPTNTPRPTNTPYPSSTPTPRPTQTMTSDALAYLNHALDLIQEYSYYRKTVDWTAIRNAAYDLADGANTPTRTYAAINLIFQEIGDTHGGITLPYSPGGAQNTPGGAQGSYFESSVGKLLGERLGYILMPNSNFSDDVVADQYVNSMQREIEKIDQFHPCGWIVDLRGNPGGWYSPMEVGIGPILGEGVLGGPIDADGKITYLTYQDGIGRLGDEVEFVAASPYHLMEPNPPVAVLTDGGTSSAAELLTVVFRGRPDTRSFGQPTGGHNPGMGKVFALEDGGILEFTTQLETDRTGKIYPEAPIQPDEVVSLPNDKSVPQAAMDWLLGQPACNPPQGITPSP